MYPPPHMDDSVVCISLTPDRKIPRLSVTVVTSRSLTRLVKNDNDSEGQNIQGFLAQGHTVKTV